MSVIAKMNVLSINNFGSGMLIELQCVCENDLMAAYAESHEDKLFTKYSPWGEARLHVGPGQPPLMDGDQVYMMILSQDELGGNEESLKKPRDNGAIYGTRLAIRGVTDRGEGQAKQVEFDGGMDPSGVTNFRWKMSVDNPGATDQLKAGSSGYRLEMFKASKFNRDQAIEAAHA
jgi:hypothetical protein